MSQLSLISIPRRRAAGGILVRVLAGWLGLGGVARAQEDSLAEFLGPGVNLADPAQRAAVAGRMRGVEQGRRLEALRQAARRGLRTRFSRPDGAVLELMEMNSGRPRYVITHNLNAGISTGADLLRAAPYALLGQGVTVGLWDGGAARASHQEFGGRVTVMDGAAVIDHATHVGGTIGAAGVIASARGMATAVRLDSYDWTNDKSEMTLRGATYPGEPGRIYLSNHSYGFVAGWVSTGLSSPAWEWYGSGTTAAGRDANFGRYASETRDLDALAVGAPYYLIFRSAGNDRFDNPTTGQPVALTVGSSTTVAYNASLHPPGDANYKTSGGNNGYDTISYAALGKNVLTVGSVADAVSGGTRNTGLALLSSFSSCGPADDGRIKPDVVANGESLFSSLSSTDASYGTFSGTSMASPDAAGSAALLIQAYGELFPGGALRASTLKALLIHTADDLGPAGPDYRTGWGLVNVRAAADLLRSYPLSPGSRQLVEGRLTTAAPQQSYRFLWDGVSPIRATLAWTDPAGTSTSTTDSRTARLVNNLDLKITAPDAAVVSPYIMPYVGSWTNANLAAPATRGTNNTDNVEQVLISAPSAAGEYVAVVSRQGTLKGGDQIFSLIVSGSAAAAAPAPAVTAVSPAGSAARLVRLTLTGSDLLLGATVKLTRSGQPDLPASGVEALGASAVCRVDLTGAAPGAWHVVVVNPDGQSAVLADAFKVLTEFGKEDLESGAVGWTHGNSQGSIDNWALSTVRSASATHSFYAAGPDTPNLQDLASRSFALPAGATDLQLTFQHYYDFENNYDAGLVELAVDGGAWFEIGAEGSGAVFSSGGYSSVLNAPGNPISLRSCWTGTSGGFVEAVVNLTDSAKYAGHQLRVRWRLGTDEGTTSPGWYVDDLSLAGIPPPPNAAPQLTNGPLALPTVVTSTSTGLSVAAADDAGEALLTYTWTAAVDNPAPTSFSPNGSHAAATTTVSFVRAGEYHFTVTAQDAGGLVASGAVPVTVQAQPSTLSLTPPAPVVGKGESVGFTAAVADQFGALLVPVPVLEWRAAGGGVIDAAGIYTASLPGGPYAVGASIANGESSPPPPVSGGAAVTVTGERLEFWRGRHFTAEEISLGLAAEEADADGDGFPNLAEYAFGTDPRADTPWFSNTLDAAGRLSLTVTLPKALPGVNYIGEASDNIDTWLTPVPLEILTEGDPQTVRLTDPQSQQNSRRRFLRLRFERP